MCDPPLILLLVEDQPLREALAFSLETEGYVVSMRPDRRPVAAVIIDDGGQAWPEVGERPTIVLTGDAERLLRRGVRGVSLMEKPLLGDALSERLSQVLKLPIFPANAGTQIEPPGAFPGGGGEGAFAQTHPNETGPRHSPGRSD